MRSVVVTVLVALGGFGAGLAAGTGLMWPQAWGSGYLAGQAARPEPVRTMTAKEKIDALTKCYELFAGGLPGSVNATYGLACLNNVRTISGDDKVPAVLPAR